VNQNGKWDGPNGSWDSNSVIWAETRVAYTGAPADIRILDPSEIALLPDTTNPIQFDVFGAMPGPAETKKFDFFLSDRNLNPVVPTTTTYSVKAELGNVTATITKLPSTLDQLPMGFTQLFCETQAPDATNCTSACKSAPCYRTTKISNYAYGPLTEFSITGVKVPSDTVTVSANVVGVDYSTSISGSVK